MKTRDLSLKIFTEYLDRGFVNKEYYKMIREAFPDLSGNEMVAVERDIWKMVEMTRKRFLRRG